MKTSIRISLLQCSIFLIALCPLHAACEPLGKVQRKKIKVESNGAACFQIVVNGKQPQQLSVNQPIDLLFEFRKEQFIQRIDGFEFGTETLTIDAPGTYMISILATNKLERPTWTNLSVSPLTNQIAAKVEIAEQLSSQAKLSKERTAWLGSIDSWKSLGRKDSVARSYLMLGDEALARDDARQAQKDYDSARVICQQIADPRCGLEANTNSGAAAERMGDFTTALTRYRQATVIARSVGSIEGLGILYSNLGALSYDAGDYQQSISYSNQAATLLSSLKHPGLAICWNILGLSFQSLEEYAKARGYFERAIAMYSSRGAEVKSIVTRLNLGRNFLLAGEAKTAETQLRNAAQLAKDSQKDRTLANILSNLGQALLAQNRWNEGEKALTEALERHRKYADRRFEAVDLHQLGLVAMKQKDYGRAREFLNQSLSIRTQSGMKDAATDSYVALAELESASGDLGQAKKWALQAVESTEHVRRGISNPALRASFRSRRQRVFDLLIELEASPEGKFVAAERSKARSLLDVMQENQQRGKVKQILSGQRLKLQNEIDFIASQLATAPEARRAELRQKVEMLVAQEQELEARIQAALPGREMVAPLESLSAIQAELRASNAALLEFQLGEKESWLWLLTADRVDMVSLPARALLEAKSASFSSLFGDIQARRRSARKQSDFQAARLELSRLLLSQIRSELPERVIVVADGNLARVPFAALDWQGSPLGLKKDLLQLPSATFLLAGKAIPQNSTFPKSVLALADPIFGPRNKAWPLSRLPFTEDVAVLEKLVPEARRSILRGMAANLGALRQTKLATFAYLHFSTHALVDDQLPEVSRIALSLVNAQDQAVDGYVRAPELADWGLKGSTVVLSACQTALGKQVKGEGLLGLTTSLFQGGAGQAIVSLSQVDGEASASFFASFYQNVFGKLPHSNERSLREARIAIHRNRRWADPYFWASFVLYGRPSHSIP